mmetsp:Transcript_160411/g.514839  ORF Transcript_160411/g.514839 Transcript_160411/m.514839 type:complete len:502 (-) Transcript_160411:421-1926(-)
MCSPRIGILSPASSRSRFTAKRSARKRRAASRGGQTRPRSAPPCSLPSEDVKPQNLPRRQASKWQKQVATNKETSSRSPSNCMMRAPTICLAKLSRPMLVVASKAAASNAQPSASPSSKSVAKRRSTPTGIAEPPASTTTCSKRGCPAGAQAITKRTAIRMLVQWTALMHSPSSLGRISRVARTFTSPPEGQCWCMRATSQPWPPTKPSTSGRKAMCLNSSTAPRHSRLAARAWAAERTPRCTATCGKSPALTMKAPSLLRARALPSRAPAAASKLPPKLTSKERCEAWRFAPAALLWTSRAFGPTFVCTATAAASAALARPRNASCVAAAASGDKVAHSAARKCKDGGLGLPASSTTSCASTAAASVTAPLWMRGESTLACSRGMCPQLRSSEDGALHFTSRALASKRFCGSRSTTSSTRADVASAPPSPPPAPRANSSKASAPAAWKLRPTSFDTTVTSPSLPPAAIWDGTRAADEEDDDEGGDANDAKSVFWPRWAAL